MPDRNRIDPSTLLRVAVTFLAVFAALPMFLHPRSESTGDIFDLIRGVLLGIAIGLICWSQVAAQRKGLDQSNGHGGLPSR